MKKTAAGKVPVCGACCRRNPRNSDDIHLTENKRKKQ